MANRDMLAIGTSAGGFEALRSLARAFPADFPAAILVTIHLAHGFRSELERILSGDGPLPAAFAEDGMKPERGHIYLAPAGCHLLADGTLSLGHGPRENNTRPAIDPMFRSVAVCCGPRAVGAVLTGTMADGAAGLWALKRCGGIAVVQDPEDAAYPEMPTTALIQAKPDHIVKLVEMPELLTALARSPAGQAVPVPDSIRFEVSIARDGRNAMSDLDRFGRRSVLTCPDCNGIMWEIDEGELVRYRCHVGHAYTAELMALALDETLHRALSNGLRALEERSALAQKLGHEARERGHRRVADSWARKAEETEREATIVRDSLQRLDRAAAADEKRRAAAE
ncbi:MAG TPA: chemotaxis protein CheB [Pseudolabrys sp.]|nr:chemotaxis protein CheB [Pseudolabrys sp.]